MMNCPICKSENRSNKFSNFPGYIEDTKYDILECVDCNTQYIDVTALDTKIYDAIYSKEETPGYDRYFYYAKNIKNEKEPLKWLSFQESTYYPIYLQITDKKRLKILEVGCGYGYLTYSILRMGHDIIGIDIAKNAIEFARSNFGDNYYLKSIHDITAENKFDVIIATELIEHLQTPVEFIRTCLKLLNDDGKIIITTPNKEYLPHKAVWKTDLPPVHTVWLSKKSFRILSAQLNVDCNFVNFAKSFSPNENKLIAWISYRLKLSNLPQPVITKNGSIINRTVAPVPLIRKILKYLIYFFPVIKVSNFCFNLFRSEGQTLGVILTKKLSVQ